MKKKKVLWRSLNKKDFDEFMQVYLSNCEFDLFNRDFFDIYEKSSFIERILLRRKVRVLKFDEKIIGYIWVDSFVNKECTIRSMYFDQSIEKVDYSIKGFFQNNTEISCICEESNYNTRILKKMGFFIKEGIYELKISSKEIKKFLTTKPEVYFEKFAAGEDEKLRAVLQNMIFKSSDRVDLTDEDIYFDEMQDYYIEEASIFLRNSDGYIGYGQIIDEENAAVIVNFGIVEEYRCRGYGKYLLNFLLDLAVKLGYEKIKIRVDYKNTKAINLYLSSGFILENKIYTWNLKK